MTTKWIAFLAFWIAVGAAIAAAGTVRADSPSDYASALGGIGVCAPFDSYGVNDGTIGRIGVRLMRTRGFTSMEAAVAVFDSVAIWCPEYMPALQALATKADKRQLI